MPLPAPFVDHYEVVGGDPSTPCADLRRMYFDKLKSFHPDKRQTSLHGLGHKMTQALNEAWSILSDPEKKQTYDIIWQRETGAAYAPEVREPSANVRRHSARRAEEAPAAERERFSCEERAEACRHDGNEFYKAAQALAKAACEVDVDSPQQKVLPAQALHKYLAAIAKYSVGLELAPRDHRLYGNRSLCYLAIKDWARARDDARRGTQLKPEFMKAWFLLVKSIWKGGAPAAANRELEAGLRLCPDSAELLSLQGDLAEELRGDSGGAGVGAPCARNRGSKNVSPSGAPDAPSQAPPPPDYPPPPGQGRRRPRASSCPPSNRVPEKDAGPRYRTPPCFAGCPGPPVPEASEVPRGSPWQDAPSAPGCGVKSRVRRDSWRTPKKAADHL